MCFAAAALSGSEKLFYSSSVHLLEGEKERLLPNHFCQDEMNHGQSRNW